jgi:hypothetical protein
MIRINEGFPSKPADSNQDNHESIIRYFYHIIINQTSMKNATKNYLSPQPCTISEKRILCKVRKIISDLSKDAANMRQRCAGFMDAPNPTSRQLDLLDQLDTAFRRVLFFDTFLSFLKSGHVRYKITKHYFLSKKLIKSGTKDHLQVLPLLKALYDEALATIPNESENDCSPTRPIRNWPKYIKN